jgi:hypothetical protein
VNNEEEERNFSDGNNFCTNVNSAVNGAAAGDGVSDAEQKMSRGKQWEVAEASRAACCCKPWTMDIKDGRFSVQFKRPFYSRFTCMSF